MMFDFFSPATLSPRSINEMRSLPHKIPTLDHADSGFRGHGTSKYTGVSSRQGPRYFRCVRWTSVKRFKAMIDNCEATSYIVNYGHISANFSTSLHYAMRASFSCPNIESDQTSSIRVRTIFGLSNHTVRNFAFHFVFSGKLCLLADR